MHTKPGFIQVPLTLKSDLGLLLFSNLISMTPGTLSIDIDKDRKEILVHVLYKKSENEQVMEVQKLQEKIRRIIRQ